MLQSILAALLLASSGFEGVTIVHSAMEDGEPGVEKVPHEYPKSAKPILVELGMEQPGKEFSIELKGLKPGKDVRVTSRFQSSVSLSDEGPHLDLLEWKHGYTPWAAVQASNKRYLLPTVPDGLDDTFPKYSQSELRDEVKKRGGERWLKVLDNPDLGGPLVLPSELQVRIQQRTATGWTTVQKIRFTMWMGC